MIHIVRYTADKKAEWDSFVRESKNGTFLFLRDYMEYHADRFEDYSLMYYKGATLLSLLPANKSGDALWSHQGLTYGGLVLSNKAHAAEIGEMFDETIHFLHEAGIKEWYYKQMPTVYHKQPSEDDTYWLWRNGAETIECNLMSAINLHSEFHISPSRRNNSNKLKREGWKIVEGQTEEEEQALLEEFWEILTRNLHDKYDSKPVHTLEEMKRLQKLFPNNIRCIGAISPEGTMEGGTVIYLSDQVARTQYMSASPRGKKSKAMDLLITEIIKAFEWVDECNVIDFGTSMEDDSVHLKEPLIQQKEGFGARGIACRTYKICIRS